jgi:trehalose synthase
VTVKDVEVARLDPRRFQAVLDPEDCRRFLARLAQAAERLAGRRLWQVSSTEQGGGVAEMLHFLLGYLAGAGIDARWVVLEGNQDFFAVTKRVHHLLHGQPGAEGSWTSRPEASTARPSRKPLESCSRGSSRATSSSCTTPRPPGWRPPSSSRVQP